jgi:hypothetical protein
LNETIRNRARGDYIAIHHSDDVWLPAKLEKQIGFLDSHPEIAALFTQVRLIDEHGRSFDDPTNWYTTAFQQPNRGRHEWLNYFFLVGNCLCHPSILARRNVMLEAGLYDRRFGQIIDFDLWVRICLKHQIHILEETLTLFRIRSGEANQSGHKADVHIRSRNEWPIVLGRYLQLQDETEFFSIFPEMRARACAKNNCLPFLLALRAIDSPSEFRMAFGLNLLYTLMERESVASDIREKYGFGYKDLIALSGRIDCLGGGDVFRLANEIVRVKSTVSWKITKPLRFLANLSRLVRRTAKRDS